MMAIWSCNPSKKLDKLNEKHPELLAKFCRDTFPCVTSKVETFTSFDTNYVKINCAEYNYDSAFIDTIWLTHSKTQLIKGDAVLQVLTKTNTIIKTIRDSAEIRSCEQELITCNNKCNDLLQQNNKLQNKVTAKNRWLMWLIIALLCSILCNVLQLKK
jgi:predicted nucleic acid-binding Zn ribbon protein